MRPIFEYRFVDALSFVQIRALICRDTAVENVMVAAFDDIDRVDLYIAEMFNGKTHSFRAVSERRRGVQLLCMKPDASGVE